MQQQEAHHRGADGAEGHQQQQQRQGPGSIWGANWQGYDPTVLDRNTVLEAVTQPDFATLDVTRSAQTLLRIREQLLEGGTP
ncbi:MAG TPA: hypothetical protein VF587_12870 [Solirubrobacteraceae bacterium]